MTTRVRISAGDGDPRHGTANGYGNLYCRCEGCRKAWAAVYYERSHREREALLPGDPRHGTSSAYRYWHCKCAVCLAAHSTYTAASKQRRRKAGRP